MLVDTHVHLSRRELAPEREAVLERAAAAGVTRLIEVGYDLPSSEAAARLAGADPRIAAAVGVHPHDATVIADAGGRLTPAGEAALARLEALASRERVVAIGEIGLDFFRDLSPRPAQRTAFAVQLALADRLGLPVVLHVRDAYPETLATLESVGWPRAGGVLHAFSGDAATAQRARERGFRLGIGGPVTYKGSALPAILAGCRPQDVLLETDAPWLPPVPHRGQRNEPAFLRLTAEKVAGVFGLSLAEVAEVTTASSRALFGFPE